MNKQTEQNGADSGMSKAEHSYDGSNVPNPTFDSTYCCSCRLCVSQQPLQETKPSSQDAKRCRWCSGNHWDVKCPTKAIWAAKYEMEVHMACGGVQGGIEEKQK